MIGLHHGDCLEIMPLIQDKSIDMILCDLPYGTTQCSWDIIIPFDKLWQQYERVIKDNGAIVLTSSQPFTSKLIMSNFKLFRYEWIWNKNMGSNFLMVKKQPMKQHENILIFSIKNANYYPLKEKRLESGLKRVKSSPIKGGGASKMCVYGDRKTIIKKHDEKRYPQTVQKFNVERGLHPTQKPVGLMEYLIKTYTNEGDTVLDNCMGSGTTGVACKMTGRKFIGIEKELKYFNIANNRITGMLL